jgi:Mg-chelatase subunit ChlD
MMQFTIKQGNETRIRNFIKNIRHTPYTTAFYDALGQAIDKLCTINDDKQKWIVALTDGVDNQSIKHTSRSLAKIIESVDFALNLVVIGVGPELSMIEYEISRIVNATTLGRYIPIYSERNVAQEIEKAFKKVQDMMASSEIEGFNPEGS